MEDELTQLAKHYSLKKVIMVSVILIGILVVGGVLACFFWPGF